MKHESTINQILALYHEPWMNAQDRADFNQEILVVMGKTMEQLDEEIEEGVHKGHSPETQVAMVRVVIALLRVKETL